MGERVKEMEMGWNVKEKKEKDEGKANINRNKLFQSTGPANGFYYLYAYLTTSVVRLLIT